MTTTAIVVGPRLGAVLFAVCLAFPLAAEEAPNPPESQIKPPPLGVVLMDEEAGYFIYGQTASTEIPVWRPSRTDIERLEKLLPEHMRQVKTPADYQPLDEYYRQYAGGIRDGKKVIFVNLFHSSSAKGWVEAANQDSGLQKRQAERGIKEDTWLYELLTVCDGGAYYFTIELDVETGKFSYPSFNGYA